MGGAGAACLAFLGCLQFGCSSADSQDLGYLLIPSIGADVRLPLSALLSAEEEKHQASQAIAELAHSGHLQQAEALLSKLRPSWSSSYDRAAVLLALSHSGFESLALQALEEIERAKASAPDSVLVEAARALILLKLGLPRSASESLESLRGRSGASETLSLTGIEQAVDLAGQDFHWREQLEQAAPAHWNDQLCRGAAVAAPVLLRKFAETQLMSRLASTAALTEDIHFEEWLDVGKCIGMALHRERGDQMFLDGFRELGAWVESSPPPQRRYATSLNEYSQAVLAVDSGRWRDARLHFEDAAKLRSASPVFGALSNYYLVYMSMQQAGGREPEALEAKAQALLDWVEKRNYPALRGRLHWRLGISQAERGKNAEAIAHLEAGKLLLEAAMGPELAGIGNLLLAQEWSDIGDSARAWKHRIAALSQLAASRNTFQYQAALTEAAKSYGFSGKPELSRIFLHESILLAKEHGLPELQLYVELASAEFALSQSDSSQALAHLATAESILKESRVRQDLEQTIEAWKALAALQSGDRQALTTVDSAIDHYRATDDFYQLLPALVHRATSHSADGAWSDFERDVLELVHLAERQHGSVADRSQFFAFHKVQDLVSQLIDRMRADGRVESALALGQRRRARYLRALSGAKTAAVEPQTILRTLPSGTALLRYEFGANFLYLDAFWSERWDSLVLNRDDSILLAERFIAELRAGRVSSGHDEDARALYDRLVGVLELDFQEIDRIVICADGPLEQISFSALIDRSGRRLIARAAVARTQSLATFFARRTWEGSGHAVVVGDAEQSATDLPQLIGATKEIRQVGAIYPRSEILSDTASVSRILAALREASVFHFAGHSLTAEELYGSTFVVATSSTPGRELIVPMAAFEKIDLQLELAVLSACRTALGPHLPGEGTFGPAALFAAKGTRSVLASVWDVEDQETAELMVQFHSAIARGLSASTALRQTVTQSNPSVTAWAHLQVFERADRALEIGGALYEEAL